MMDSTPGEDNTSGGTSAAKSGDAGGGGELGVWVGVCCGADHRLDDEIVHPPP
eukprot:CAMPEP_0185310672 /NCGR_PEP_ID=MMETSP1363-20130426/25535_1 /TAXON_ID=38817 /ORGANISM="Gephyrocapsa oceanica, Strain RCC1303" /LENGTH=52 /DNA_ID=CAMNT_0027908255 /DNA_START=26 /DNA_END=181 /DNA_ORIENTATION=+